MFKILERLFNKKEDIKKVAEEQLKKNAAAIQSLKDYDEGKKDISTSHIERDLPTIRVAPRT
jgi:hypothetical protein